METCWRGWILRLRARCFTSRYRVIRLVWFAQGEDIVAAIALEKKIENRGRQWKIDLIEKQNTEWENLTT